jgi:hypothetical protein
MTLIVAYYLIGVYVGYKYHGWKLEDEAKSNKKIIEKGNSDE